MKDPEMCGRHSVTKRCNLAPKTRPSSPKHYCHQADTLTIGLTLAGTQLRNVNYENTMFIDAPYAFSVLINFDTQFTTHIHVR